MNELYKEIKTEYLNGKSLRMLSKEYHVGRDTLSNFLKSENITIRKSNITSRKYSCDENYFECIDNEEKAYWLGFLYADGFIESKRGTYSQKFGIMLSYRDRKHLEKFNKCLNSNYVIHDYEGSGYNKSGKFSRLLITSQKMVNDLKNLGCVEQKTSSLVFPTENQVPKKLQKDFIRGMIDGDGSVFISNTPMFSFLGTYDIVNNVKNILKLSVKTIKDERCEHIYYFNASARKNFSALKWLYEDSAIYLDRKFEMYCKIKSLIE